MSYRGMRKRLEERELAAKALTLQRSIRRYERFPFPKIGALALLTLLSASFVAGLIIGHTTRS